MFHLKIQKVGLFFMVLFGLSSYAQNPSSAIQFVDFYSFLNPADPEDLEAIENPLYHLCLKTTIKERDLLQEKIQNLNGTIIKNYSAELNNQNSNIDLQREWLKQFLPESADLLLKLIILDYVEELNIVSNLDLINKINNQAPVNTMEDLKAGHCDTFFKKALEDPSVHILVLVEIWSDFSTSTATLKSLQTIEQFEKLPFQSLPIPTLPNDL